MVVDVHEVVHPVLLQHHEVVQGGAAFPGAVLTVHNWGRFGEQLPPHEQQVEHLHLTDGAVVRSFVSGPRSENSLFPGRRQSLLHPLTLLQRPQ